MDEPNKFKSVSVPIETYKLLKLLGNEVLVKANLTVSSTIKFLPKN